MMFGQPIQLQDDGTLPNSSVSLGNSHKVEQYDNNFIYWLGLNLKRQNESGETSTQKKLKSITQDNQNNDNDSESIDLTVYSDSDMSINVEAPTSFANIDGQKNVMMVIDLCGTSGIKKTEQQSADSKQGKKQSNKPQTDEDWIQNYEELKKYLERNKSDLQYSKTRTFPSKKIQLTHIKKWLNRQCRLKNQKALSEERIQLLQDIGFDFKECRSEQQFTWEQQYDKLKEYFDQHGSSELGRDYQDTTNLRAWINNQRNSFARRTMKQDKIDLLNAVGFQWTSKLKRTVAAIEEPKPATTESGSKPATET